MATASVLPDVAARITPQMGGGDATQSMLPNVGDPSIIARQLGGKPLKMKPARRTRSKKQRGGEQITEEQKQFAKLFGKKVLSTKREKDENFTDDEINLIRKYILDEEFINSIYKNIKSAKENEWVKPIYDNINKLLDSFIKILKSIFYTDKSFTTLNDDSQIPGKLRTLIKVPSVVELNNGAYIILLNNFFETGIITKEALIMLKTIANTTKTPTQIKSTEFGEYIDKLNNKIAELKLTTTVSDAPGAVPAAQEPSETTATETKSNTPIVSTEDICYEKLREEMKANPDFTSIIENLMSKTPGDLKDLLYSPTHADVRKILREMITLKVEQFKTALSEARREKTGVNVGTKGNVMALNTETKTETPEVAKTEAEAVAKADAEAVAKADAEAVAKADAEAVAKADAEAVAKPEPKTEPKEMNYRDTYAGRYSDYFEDQTKALCGLHSLNNLFIEEREQSLIPVKGETKQAFTEEDMKKLCNDLQEAANKIEEGTNYDCNHPAGYYNVEVLTRAIDSIPGKPYETVQQSISSAEQAEEIRSKVGALISRLVEEIIPIVSTNADKYGIIGFENLEQVLREDINSIFNDSNLDLTESKIQNENYRELLRAKYLDSTELAALGARYQELQRSIMNPRENVKTLMREIIEDDSFIGAIIGNGAHYIAVRKIGPYILEVRNSMNKTDKIERLICEGMTGAECPNKDAYLESVMNRLFDNYKGKGIMTYTDKTGEKQTYEGDKYVLLGVRKTGASANKVTPIVESKENTASRSENGLLRPAGTINSEIVTTNKMSSIFPKGEPLPPIQEVNESKNSNNENNKPISKGGAKTRNHRKGIRVKNTKRRQGKN